MKVGDLIEVLKTIDPETVVVMSSDEEGNTYAPLATLNGGDGDLIFVEDGWSSSIKYAALTEQLRSWNYTEEAIYDEEEDGAGVPAIVLYPS